ncbi:hypothetical protein [Streptomyces sp. NPDC102360]|uniref:hypothetical protein n=1 Tax=Streptomyces sp. NPDC102360 TaxID=3366160 RepID=UPI0037FA1FD2
MRPRVRCPRAGQAKEPEIHRIPGTDEWIGAGKVEASQFGDPFGAPVVVRLERG